MRSDQQWKAGEMGLENVQNVLQRKIEQPLLQEQSVNLEQWSVVHYAVKQKSQRWARLALRSLHERLSWLAKDLSAGWLVKYSDVGHFCLKMCRKPGGQQMDC